MQRSYHPRYSWLFETAVTAFTYELDHDHPVTPDVEQAIRDALEPGVDPKMLIQSTPAVRRALWKLGERRFPHLRYDFHDDQWVLGTEDRMNRIGEPDR